VIADCVARYAGRLHSVIGTRHHVASPLGAWLLLALAGPASDGPDRAVITDALGCDVDVAAQAAADLLASPHPFVAAATAVWTADGEPLNPDFARWQAALPPQVAIGQVPSQAGLDAWAREHTFGLIDRFPIRQADQAYLLMASALATKVSWQVPFDLVPGDRLGQASPWAGQLSQVLRTPDEQNRPGHVQFIAVTPEAGDVAVHLAAAVGGLLVVSVIAQPEVPADRVLAAAHRIGAAKARGDTVAGRDLADLPLGETALWLLREETAVGTDACIAVLPAWTARSEHDLADPSLGLAAARNALAPGADPWQARQSAMARYTRTGFEAAAVSALAVMLAMRRPGKRRVAELRFGHPYAVVAVTLTGNGAAAADPWQGMPVFSAWVSEPESATAE
jgi:hypothetical protein